MGRSTNVPFSILISARLPLLTLRASATAFGMRTARLFPHLQNSTIMALLRKVDTMYIQCSYGLQAFWIGDSLYLWLVPRLPNAETVRLQPRPTPAIGQRRYCRPFSCRA